MEAVMPEAAAPVAIVEPRPVLPPGMDAPNSSLYVGDLDKSIAETDLYDVFSEMGPLHSIRVCRDTVTRRSLGYAYVNYNLGIEPNAAKQAMEKLNYKEIKGKPVRIMWANRNAGVRKNKEGNIFIKNLEKDVTTRLLHDTFSSFGPILSCKVALDKDLKSKGYGFVQFENPEHAQEAIESVNGMTLGEDSEKVVTVCEFLSRNERGEGKRRYTNLYVKNLSDSVKTEEDLTKMFEEYGTISSAVVMTDSRLGKQYGFVNFETPEAAMSAKEALHGKEVDGSVLFVDRAQSKAERADLLKRKYAARRMEQENLWQGRNVYVKNLPDNFDEDKLKGLFQEYGEIQNTKIMRDTETKAPRGFGFVCFTTPESAQSAVQAMHGQTVEGKMLYVVFAQSKAMRAQELENMAKMKAMQQPMLSQGRGMNQPMQAMPAIPGMGFGMGPYPGMMAPYARMPMNAVYPGMMQNGNRGMHNGGRSNVANNMMQMNPGMMQMQPGMMPMAPGMMAGPGMAMGGGRGGRGGIGGRGMSGRGGRAAGGPGGRGRGPPRGAPVPGAPGAPGAVQPGMLPQQRGPMPMHAQQAMPAEREEMNLTSKLNGMSESEQKQHLGELLFPKISGMLQHRYSSDNAEKLASKVTGMFLEMDTTGLLYLLDTDSECKEKIDEALDVLRQHGAMPEGCQ